MMPDAEGDRCEDCQGSGVVHPETGIFGTQAWLKEGVPCMVCQGAGSFCKVGGCSSPSWSANGLCTEHDEDATNDLVERWEKLHGVA